MAYDEDVIRDFLAADLDIIEPGLQLVDKEYYLPNNVGSRGFIDILARDKHGLIVVIELKRSDGAARQCIHELFKYTGLLGQNDNLRLDQMRCVAVSTEWHELLLPFSELYHTGNLQLSGYKLTVDSDGRPVSAETVEPLASQSGTEICPEHTVFLFESMERRREGLRRLQKNLSNFKIVDYILAELDYAGDDGRVIHPFGLFFALPTMSYFKKGTLHERVQAAFDDDCSYPVEMAISVAIQDGLDFDSVEISYPDKFIYLLSDGMWKIVSWHNSGGLKVSLVRPPELILAEISGFDSGQGSSFHKTLTPDSHMAWDRFIKNVSLHTNWCDGWKPGLFEFLDGIGHESSVSVSIYAPDDLLEVMHKVFIENDMSYLPIMEVIVSDHSGITDILIGCLGWSGEPVKGELGDFLRDTYEGFENYRMIQHFAEQRDFEDVTCKFFGLEYITFGAGDEATNNTSPLDIKAYGRLNSKVIKDLQSAFQSFPIKSL
ncbi:endonuclease NucS domain-containing protein [Paenarthrobacter sp. NPDC090520]|uniref:endonuclease NucS domain-containing protein n=1 Tax=Paenarthrobacter sp. NPDC090520 TaxID=3364382 RepID=UPI0038049FB0